MSAVTDTGAGSSHAKRGPKKKKARADRSLATPRAPSQVKREDHFLSNRATVTKLNQLIVDKDPRVKAKSANELHNKLLKFPELIQIADTVPVSTMIGWFDWPKKKKLPAEVIVPNKKFRDGIERGDLAGMRCGGRKATLQGAEDSLAQVTSDLKALRVASINLSTISCRAMIVSQLVNDGHSDLVSPHLFNPDINAKDKKKFLCSPFWMRAFLINECGFSWKLGTKAAQHTPANWKELVQGALQRIAAAAAAYNIPADRVYCADETYMFFTPDSKCALILIYTSDVYVWSAVSKALTCFCLQIHMGAVWREGGSYSG